MNPAYLFGVKLADSPASYYGEVLRMRPGEVLRPIGKGALGGALAGGVYDLWTQHGREGDFDYKQLAKHMGVGGAIGAGIGAIPGARRGHRIAEQQAALDKYGPQSSVYSQALDNVSPDVRSFNGRPPVFAPVQEGKYTRTRAVGSPEEQAFVANMKRFHLEEVSRAGPVPSKDMPFNRAGKPDGAVTRIGTRGLSVEVPMVGKDVDGRGGSVLLHTNAPRNADDRWRRGQVNAVREHANFYSTSGLPDDIADAYPVGTPIAPENVSRLRSIIETVR